MSRSATSSWPPDPLNVGTIPMGFAGVCTFCDVVIERGMPRGGENPRSRVPVGGNVVVGSKKIDLWKSFGLNKESESGKFNL